LKGRCAIEKKVVPVVPKETLRKLRKFIREARWKTASSPAYRDAPHAYVIAFWYPDPQANFDNKTPWKWFGDLIREHGEYKTWKGHKYKYLTVDKKVFWVDFPALNCADANTLDEVKDRPKVKLR